MRSALDRAQLTCGAAIVVLVVVSGVLVGCGESDDQGSSTTAMETSTMTEETTSGASVIVVSDAGIETFSTWYRDAVTEGGDKVPVSLLASNATSDDAFRRLILSLCALDAPDTPSRHAAAAELKDDPEWFGDAALAASGIVMAQIACGQG